MCTLIATGDAVSETDGRALEIKSAAGQTHRLCPAIQILSVLAVELNKKAGEMSLK